MRTQGFSRLESFNSVDNEAPRSKLRGIQAEFAEANPPSHEAPAGHLAIHPCSKLERILAKANKCSNRLEANMLLYSSNAVSDKVSTLIERSVN